MDFYLFVRHQFNSQSEEERSTESTRATNSEEFIVDEEHEASRCSGTKNEEARESSDRSEALSIFTRTIDMPEQQLPVNNLSSRSSVSRPLSKNRATRSIRRGLAFREIYKSHVVFPAPEKRVQLLFPSKYQGRPEWTCPSCILLATHATKRIPFLCYCCDIDHFSIPEEKKGTYA